ncbi:helix-turn-helix domain-containing protein [Microvirga ossetica]
MAQGSCATQVAARTGRHPQTVMGWLHAYHTQGPAALAYGRTGGRPPFVPEPPPVSARSCARPRVRRPRRP